MTNELPSQIEGRAKDKIDEIRNAEERQEDEFDRLVEDVVMEFAMPAFWKGVDILNLRGKALKMAAADRSKLIVDEEGVFWFREAEGVKLYENRLRDRLWLRLDWRVRPFTRDC